MKLNARMMKKISEVEIGFLFLFVGVSCSSFASDNRYILFHPHTIFCFRSVSSKYATVVSELTRGEITARITWSTSGTFRNCIYLTEYLEDCLYNPRE